MVKEAKGYKNIDDYVPEVRSPEQSRRLENKKIKEMSKRKRKRKEVNQACCSCGHRLHLLGSSGRRCKHDSENSNLGNKKLDCITLVPSAPGVINSLTFFICLMHKGQEKVLKQRTTDVGVG